MSNPAKTGRKKSGRPLDPKSRRAIAERLSIALGFPVTEEMVTAWQEAGHPLDDVAALRRELATQQRLPEGMDESPEAQSLREQILRAELRRKLASADKLEQEAARTRGELVERAGLKAQAEGVGLATRQMLEKLANDLPAQLGGRPAAEIAKILRREFRAALQNLADTPAQRFIDNLLSQ